MRLAARRGRFAIVTGGVRWRPMLERLARALGLESSLQQIELVSLTGAQLAADPPGALRLLARACQDATRSGADSVILGGAALVGMAASLAPQVPVPLIDNVQAGGEMMREALATAAGAAPAGPDGARWQGISAELAALLGPRG
jgi:Asp/Glu/hydantoin racemase